MSHQGYSPYQHYVPPAQPQYAQEQQQQQFEGDGYQQQYASYNTRPPMAASHATGASYTTVSSLGTGNSPGVVNYHVSGMGVNHAMGASAYGQPMPGHGTHNLPELGVQDHRPTVRSDTGPVFEMSAEPAQHAPERPAQQENIRRNDTAGQTPVQANPWPFYLDVSPTEAKKSDRVTEKETEDESKQETKEPLQAFPWPYHGPPTEEDEPQATVHPPKKDTSAKEKTTGSEAAKDTSGDRPLPLLKDNHLDKPLPPAGNDESVLDDILADMDAQDEDDEREQAPAVMEAAEAQRPAKDPTLRPPPLNLSRPQPGDATKPKVGSGAVSPGGRTYIPYRPGASPTTSPTAQSPPLQQHHHHQHAPFVTAPHHVYMPHTQTSLSPPPHPVTPHSPNSASPGSGGGFSPYRPPSPQPPLSASSTGLGIHQSQSLGALGSPTLGGTGSAGFVPYQPSTSPRPGPSHSQTHSGLTSPTHPVSPAFPPPRQSPSPRPSASPRPGRTSPRPSPGAAATSPGLDSHVAANTPYPSSPPRISSPSANKPASPAPMAFYPPPSTHAAPVPTDPIPGRLASPPMGAALGRPPSRNDSGSVHSGVSSTMGGAPVHPQDPHPRPSPTLSSHGGDSQSSHYVSPALGPQQQQQHQQPPPQPSMVTSPYQIPQQAYASPTVSSPQSASFHHPPPQPPRPTVTQASTLPSPEPSPLSPPPPYSAIDPPRPGSQPATESSYGGHQPQNYYHQPPSPHNSQVPLQQTYGPAPNQGYQYQAHHHQHQQPQNQQSPPLPNLNQALPPLPPRPSTSHNGRPPPSTRPQGFGSALPNATNFPPPPKPNYSSNNGNPPPMPPRPHHQNSYGSSHYNNKIFGSHSAKKWLDKTERLVEQTFGDILQPQVDQGYRPPGGPGGRGGGGGVGPAYHNGPYHQGGGHGHAPPQPQYAPSPGHHQHLPPQHRPLPQQGPYPDLGRGSGRR